LLLINEFIKEAFERDGHTFFQERLREELKEREKEQQRRIGANPKENRGHTSQEDIII
jgi:hypothetical protein